MLATLALALTTVPLNEGWPRFRGADGRGVAPDERAYPARLDPEQDARWRCELPKGLSSPCLTSERIFLTAGDEREVETLCVDRESGELRWRRAFESRPVERVHEVNGPASATATSDGERVVSYFGGFGLVAHDLEGAELWRRELPPPKNTFGSASSPVFAAGKLVFLHDTNEESWLEALDPASGETLWKTSREGFGSGWATPSLWRRGESLELLVNGVGWLTAYDMADGARRWAVPGLTDEPIVTPVFGDGLVFVSSYNMRTNPEVSGLPTFEDLLAAHDADGSGTLNAAEADQNASVLSRFDADTEGDHPLRMFFRSLDVDQDGEIDAQEWPKLVRWVESFQYANGLLAIRPGSGELGAEIVWQHERGVPECPSPLYYRGHVYLVKNGGLVTSLDAATGAVRFEGRLDMRGPSYASPVAADGKLYASSARGQVVVFAAGDELRVLSRNDFGERIMATPALADGQVYVRTERALYAFGSD